MFSRKRSDLHMTFFKKYGVAVGLTLMCPLAKYGANSVKTKKARTKWPRPRITFSVWRCDENPLVYGFADVGFAFGDASGQVQSSGDLVVLVGPDSCRNSIEFRVFRGVYGDRELREAILKSINPKS